MTSISACIDSLLIVDMLNISYGTYASDMNIFKHLIVPSLLDVVKNDHEILDDVFFHISYSLPEPIFEMSCMFIELYVKNRVKPYFPSLFTVFKM